MRTALPLLAVVVLGCAPHGYGDWYPDVRGPRDPYRSSVVDHGSYGPLHADLWYSSFSGDISFRVSESAYVALFVIEPGRGARMLFPRHPGQNAYVYGGLHRLDRYHRVRSGYGSWGAGWFGGRDWGWYDPWGYDRAWGTGLRPGVAYGSSGYGDWRLGGRMGPSYLFLVASKEPLATGRFAGRGYAFGFALSLSPYDVMDRLAEAVVRYPYSSDWTTAMYVVWPRPAAVRYASMPRYRAVVCWDGRTVWIPYGAHPGSYCPPGAPGRDTTRKAQPRDTTGGGGVIAVPVRPWMPPTEPGTPPWPRDRAEGEGPDGAEGGGPDAVEVPGLRRPVTPVTTPVVETGEPRVVDRRGEDGRPSRAEGAGWTRSRSGVAEPPVRRPDPPRAAPAEPRPETRPSRPEPRTRPSRPSPETRPSRPRPEEPSTRPSRPRPQTRPSPRPERPTTRPSRPQPTTRPSRPRPATRPSRPEPTSKPSRPARPSRPSRPDPPPPRRPSKPPPGTP